METTANDHQELHDAIRARYGERTHLQPGEIAELIGLKTARPINCAINRGELVASRLPHCPRLRFVAVHNFLIWMDASVMGANTVTAHRPISGTGLREQRALARVAREGRGLSNRRSARTVR